MLAAVGGLEHAAIAGFVLGGRGAGVPVLLDGVNAGAAALAPPRSRRTPSAAAWPGTAPPSRGTGSRWSASGCEPLLDLGMRLGRGDRRAARAADGARRARALHDVATFDAAGVTEKG